MKRKDGKRNRKHGRKSKGEIHFVKKRRKKIKKGKKDGKKGQQKCRKKKDSKKGERKEKLVTNEN